MTVSILPSIKSFYGFCLYTAAKQHPMGQDDSQSALAVQKVETVQQKGEIGGGLGRKPISLEAKILGQCLAWLPAVAEWRIGHHHVKLDLFGRILFTEDVPVVEKRIAVINLEFRISNPVQQHVHAR